MMTLRLLVWCNIVIMCCISCLKLYNLVHACTTNDTLWIGYVCTMGLLQPEIGRAHV